MDLLPATWLNKPLFLHGHLFIDKTVRFKPLETLGITTTMYVLHLKTSNCIELTNVVRQGIHSKGYISTFCGLVLVFFFPFFDILFIKGIYYNHTLFRICILKKTLFFSFIFFSMTFFKRKNYIVSIHILYMLFAYIVNYYLCMKKQLQEFNKN